MLLQGLGVFRDSACILSRSFSENSYPLNSWLPSAIDHLKSFSPGSRASPVLGISDSMALVFLRREETLYLVACVARECSPLLVLEVLDKIFRVLSLNISDLSLEGLKSHLPTVHSALDAVLPFGVFCEVSGQTTSGNSVSGNLFRQAEIYVDVTERWEFVASACAASSGECSSGQGRMEISSMSVAGAIEVSAQTPEGSEISMTVHASEKEISRFGFHACVRRGKFLETKRRTISCVLPPSRKFLLAEYAMIGNISDFPTLPFVVSGGVWLDAEGGKVDLEIAPLSTKANPGSACPGVEKLELEISLPEISSGGSLLCSSSGASVRLEKERILWRIGNLFSTGKARLQGSLVGNFANSTAWRPLAQVRFLVKAWTPSGLRVESLDVAVPGNQKPYKGVRYNTVAGNCEIRF